MKKKVFGSLLAGALSLTMLAGCGSGASDNPAEALKEKYSPEVILSTDTGIEYTPTKTEVTDTDVESQLNRWVMNYGETKQSTTGKAALGDKVGIDYVGRIDGKEFEGGSTQGQGTEITLGSSGYIDNFDEQIVGHEPGETFDVNVTFPDDYGTASLAGKPAVFETTLNYISTTEYPELTDALVAEKTEYKTVDEYRKHLKEDMEKEQAEQDKETDEEAVMTALIEASSVKSYPEKEMKDRIAQLTAQIENAASSYGFTLDQYLMMYGLDADQFQSDIRDGVEEYIKRKMIVAAVAQKENIEVSKDEADAKIKELLKATGLNDVSSMNSAYGYTDEDYYYIVMEEKVLEFLLEHATQKAAEDTGATTEEATESADTTEAATE